MGASETLTQLGAVIRDARMRRGWTQEELASRSRVSRNHVAGVERGANASVIVLEKLARALDLRELPLSSVTLVATEDGSVNSGLLRDSVERIQSEARLILAHLCDRAELPDQAVPGRPSQSFSAPPRETSSKRVDRPARPPGVKFDEAQVDRDPGEKDSGRSTSGQRKRKQGIDKSEARLRRKD